MKTIRTFVIGIALGSLLLVAPSAQDSIVRLTSNGWLVAPGDATPLLLGSNGKGYINVTSAGAVTFVNSATMALPAAATGSTMSLTGAASASTLTATASAVTAPTDSTAVDAGTVTRMRSSSTITPASAGVGNCAAAFLAAALTADCVIATLPAGMRLVGIVAEVTVGFTCSGTCSGTKVVQCGTAAGGTEVLAAAFNVATTGVAGDADAELGSGMTRAAMIQGGLLGSWSTTTPISCRFTSGTGNWGNASATFVNAGSIKFNITTEQIK